MEIHISGSRGRGASPMQPLDSAYSSVARGPSETFPMKSLGAGPAWRTLILAQRLRGTARRGGKGHIVRTLISPCTTAHAPRAPFSYPHRPLGLSRALGPSPGGPNPGPSRGPGTCPVPSSHAARTLAARSRATPPCLPPPSHSGRNQVRCAGPRPPHASHTLAPPPSPTAPGPSGPPPPPLR